MLKPSPISIAAASEAELEALQTRNVCYKLCSLIHAQLVKAHAEVSRYVTHASDVYVTCTVLCNCTCNSTQARLGLKHWNVSSVSYGLELSLEQYTATEVRHFVFCSCTWVLYGK